MVCQNFDNYQDDAFHFIKYSHISKMNSYVEPFDSNFGK